MAEGRNYHALEFVPGKSDPTKRWALSVKQPLAGMIATGRTAIVAKTLAPPVELIGKRIALHAGAGNTPYKDFTEDAADWARLIWGADLAELRQLLPRGGIIGTVELAAAFRIGRLDGRKAWAKPQSHYAAHRAGIWADFDGTYVFEQGDVGAERWAWCLTAAKLCDRLVPLRGYGGVFDLDGALAQERERSAGGVRS
jgi:hypothetical protein